MGLGVCCTHSVVLPPPDAVVGWLSSRALGSSHRRIGFGDHLPISPPPIADGFAGLACDKGTGDNPARGTMGLAHLQPATNSVSHMCLVPLVVCAERGGALHCVVKCRVLPELNHGIVLGIDWLQTLNPVSDW